MLTAKELGAGEGEVFVSAAVGRNHSVLVGSNGDVWTAGVNTLGQVEFLTLFVVQRRGNPTLLTVRTCTVCRSVQVHARQGAMAGK